MTPCVVSAVKFGASELILKDMTPLLVNCSACCGLAGGERPSACRVRWQTAPCPVRRLEAALKKF
jgi:hypothetical protein